MAGAVRHRVAKQIAAALEEAGYEARVEPDKLYPAEGYWRSDPRADCYRWEGSIEIFDPRGPVITYYRGKKKIAGAGGQWLPIQVGSYDTMTACQKGVTFTRESFWIEVHAKE